uniref:uncharacterized protein K02A2.6-like n=1 Tax=Styela clava TaxID=7725 RepID=UPI00193A027C|nr:uncharacterized protein K02A2.6-like [Styela clava]
MDKVLKPEKLDTDPDTRDAECEWLHWQKTFENFLEALPTVGLDKLGVLTNYVSPRTYRYIRNITTYDEAIDTLKGIFVQTKNEIYARHMLATRSQQISESVAEYLRALTELSKDCNFQNVSAKEYQNEYIRDSFIRGLNSSWIRQRLLENKKLTLDEMVDQAKSLETAVRNSQSYAINENTSVGAVPSTIQSNNFDVGSLPDNAAMTIRSKCIFCGNSRHPRSKCPAREVVCFKCQKKGHFAKVCRGRTISNNDSSSRLDISAMIPHSTLATIHDKPYVGYVTSTLRQATAW